MNPNRRRFRQLRSIIGPIEHAVQANVALIIAQAMVIRLSLEIQKTEQEDPDVLVLLGFLLTCAVTVAIAIVLYRLIRAMPSRPVRIIASLASLAIQAAAFQLIFNFAI